MEPFKNLFNKKIAEKIALAISHNCFFENVCFDKKSFLKNIEAELSPLELKQRVHFLAEKLYKNLPKDFTLAIPILLGSVKKNEQDNVGLSGMALWPLTHYISLYGLDDFDRSLSALKEMTKEFTSEFAVRPFIVKDQKKVLNVFRKWLEDDNEHVRRLVSESSRPLLPWGLKLNEVAKNPRLTSFILEKLKDDPSAYVRKSVANHLNDHSKNHPEYVYKTLLKWHLHKNKTPETEWVIKHASRTLIKKGFKKAFIFHGIEQAKIVVGHQKILTKKVIVGESLRVSLVVKNLSPKEAKIILDHEVHLLRANGSHNIKVFKGKKLTLAAGEELAINLAVPLKVVTTRVYYSGKHFWNLLVNGESDSPLPFNLESR